MAQTADAVIVGGGFAGAATAYWLSRLGVPRIVLLEQEDLPGRHASGRNAGVARCTVASRDHLPLAIEGLRFMAEPPDDFPPGTYFRRTGAMLLAGAELEAAFRASVEIWRSAGVRAEWLGADEVERRLPITAGGTFAGAAWGCDDGVADIAALLAGFLRAASASRLEVRGGRRLTAVEARGGAVAGVQTDNEYISTPVVVNAAGAWARQVARRAGASSLPLRSLKRHLMVTSALTWVDRAWPPVWDMTHDVYFRPEPPGLLLSPCDATESEPDAEAVDGAALELLAEKLTRWLPRLGEVSVASVWAGLRTFVPDGNFVLGEDSALRGFFWCAGLGGNGMALSPALGRIVAEAIVDHTPPPAAHDAVRFAHA